MMGLANRLKDITESSVFSNFIIGVIILAGVLVGVETYPEMVANYGPILHTLDSIILTIFVIEVVLKMGAQGRKPWLYFRDPWNVFDFVIVAVCFVPAAGQYALVMRMARLLRVLRLVNFIPKLRVLVMALLNSIPSMFYVTILLVLMFYMYAVAATFLFSGNDPLHFGDLQNSMLTLFRVVTLEDWTDIMYIQMYGCDVYQFPIRQELCTSPQTFPVVSPIFFVSFVLFGTMIVLNLFIGVIMGGMDEATKEAHQETVLASLNGPANLQTELDRLEEQLAAVNKQLMLVRIWSQGSQGNPPGTDGSTGDS